MPARDEGPHRLHEGGADGLASLMESAGEDMKELEDGMAEIDAMSVMIKETCSACAWDDHPCMDEIEAKYSLPQK